MRREPETGANARTKLSTVLCDTLTHTINLKPQIYSRKIYICAIHATQKAASIAVNNNSAEQKGAHGEERGRERAGRWKQQSEQEKSTEIQASKGEEDRYTNAQESCSTCVCCVLTAQPNGWDMKSFEK